MMKIAIVGTTPKAMTLARLLARTGADISISDARDPDRAIEAARAIDGHVMSDIPYHQAMASDAIVLAMPWPDLDLAVARLGPVPNALIIDAMLPTQATNVPGAQRIARAFDSQHVAEAFIEPLAPGTTISICADDRNDTALVADLVRSIGCTPRELGPLMNAGALERGLQAA
jgi:predicted dinucleotide-binding enzyme